MDEKSNADSHEQDPVVESLVKREHLNRTWIGLGAALEWIALRGQPIALNLYRDREDKADAALVALLADLTSAVAESVVRGAETGADGILVPVSSGIWRQTATCDANDKDLPFRLIGTDDHDEWEGTIIRKSQQVLQEGECPGYERAQIQSTFVLENRPEHTLDLQPVQVGPAAAIADVRRVIEAAIANAGEDIAPLTQREMLTIVKRCLPNARRNQVRDTYAEHRPSPKPGPKGARNPDRERQIEELGQKLIAAQLHN